MIYEIVLEPIAETHLDMHIKAGNKILLRKIYKLFGELEKHPETGTGKPHKLKHDKADIWSRKIDDRHRMLYTINNETVSVFVLSLWGHYDDK